MRILKQFCCTTILLATILLACFSANAKWVEQKEAIPIPENVTMLGDTVYTMVEYMDFSTLRSTLIGLERFNYKKIVIDLKTSGGSVFEAFGMVSVIDEWKAKGKIIEIRGRGLIASAGMLILASGSPGYRLLDKNSFLMFHEMWSFKFMAIETPTDKEEEAKIFRQIQDRINNFIVSHSKISLEELNARIKKKEMWMTPEEAIKYGFADKLIE